MCSCRVWVQLHTENVDPAAARVHADSDHVSCRVRVQLQLQRVWFQLQKVWAQGNIASYLQKVAIPQATPRFYLAPDFSPLLRD